MKLLRINFFIAAALLVSAPSIAQTSAPSVPPGKASPVSSFPTAKAKLQVVNTTITEAEVLAAQKAWGEALIAISTTYDQKGLAAAKALAAKVIDEAYGYQYGAVLFKPTLTENPQTFRTTREGALAYFVGDNPAFPKDKGFALKGWRKVEIENAGIFIVGNVATTMGKVSITDKTGKVTTVDKTWEFMRDDKGKLRIVVHHSSLQYSQK
jgi:hypothetical protein